MARRKRMVALNTRLITDVVFASLIVQKAPALISQFVNLDPALSNIAGIGAGYITGIFFKRPFISNASIALGLTGFLEPIIDGFIFQEIHLG